MHPKCKLASAKKEAPKKYTLDELRVPVEMLPADVDPNRRELYLSEEDFQKIFNFDLAFFQRMKQDLQDQFREVVFDDWRYGVKEALGDGPIEEQKHHEENYQLPD